MIRPKAIGSVNFRLYLKKSFDVYPEYVGLIRLGKAQPFNTVDIGLEILRAFHFVGKVGGKAEPLRFYHKLAAVVIKLGLLKSSGNITSSENSVPEWP